MKKVLTLFVELLNSLKLLSSNKWNFECGADGITNIISDVSSIRHFQTPCLCLHGEFLTWGHICEYIFYTQGFSVDT